MVEVFHWRKVIHAICLDRRVLCAAVCLCLAAAGTPHAAGSERTSPPAASAKDRSERQPRTQVISWSKTDRLHRPEQAFQAMTPSKSGARADHRVEQAFAEISRLEVALSLDEPPAAAMAKAALRPPTAHFETSARLLAAAVERAAPARPIRPTTDPQSIFALAMSNEEPTRARGRPGDGSLATPTPPDQVWDFPTASIPSDDAAAVSLPHLPSEIPVPTPRPDAPAADPVSAPPAAERLAAAERENPSGHDSGSSGDAYAGSGEADAPTSPYDDPAARDSNPQVSLPANLLPEGEKPQAERGSAPASLKRIAGTPQAAVTLCGMAVAEAARAHGRADVTATSYGRTQRLAGGGYLAPVMMRISYELEGGEKVRQAPVWCHFDRHGAVSGLSEMTG